MQKHRCREFLTIQDKFDKELITVSQYRNPKKVASRIQDGEIYRIKRAKARRLNNHLAYCRECSI